MIIVRGIATLRNCRRTESSGGNRSGSNFKWGMALVARSIETYKIADMKKLAHRLLSEIRRQFRTTRSKFRLRLIGDGTYDVPVKFYHRSLQPARCADYQESMEKYGSEISEKWSRDGCGIASSVIAVDSILRSHPDSVPLPSITSLCEDFRERAYIPGIGWSHRGLVEFAQGFGLQSFNEPNESVESICRMITLGWTPITSVTLYFRGGETYTDGAGNTKMRGKGGHLVVITGFKIADARIDGFFVDDCQNISKNDGDESIEYIKIKNFINSYSNKAIYIK
jgi:hypothetical protein